MNATERLTAFLNSSKEERAAELAEEYVKFISNPHLERKEEQAWRNYHKCTSRRAMAKWHRVWCKLLTKLRRQGDKHTQWSDWGREEYYLHKP